MRKLLLFSLFIIILINVRPQTLSAYNEEVLGVDSKPVQVPPTIEGPGLLLPDSPLYVFDHLKQALRVTFAFSSEEKAQVYASVGGERLAELRFMFAKNSASGVEKALSGISENYQQAGQEMAKAKFEGKNVSKLAKSIVDGIRLKQETLDLIEAQTVGDVKAHIAAVSQSLGNSKAKIGDSLAVSDLENEIYYDLNRKIAREATETAESAKALGLAIEELEKLASSAAQNDLKNSEEALRRAIAAKNKEKIALESKGLADARAKAAGADATAKRNKEIIERAKQTAVEFEKAKQTLAAPLSSPSAHVAGASTSAK